MLVVNILANVIDIALAVVLNLCYNKVINFMLQIKALHLIHIFRRITSLQ